MCVPAMNRSAIFACPFGTPAIGSQDLKIAAIALINDALLSSRNLRDFKKVKGLEVEDWLS